MCITQNMICLLALSNHCFLHLNYCVIVHLQVPEKYSKIYSGRENSLFYLEVTCRHMQPVTTGGKLLKGLETPDKSNM